MLRSGSLGMAISPRALTTRCQGSRCDRAALWSSRTTWRAARGWPASAAIWPYVITLPRGIDWMMAMTCCENGVRPISSSYVQCDVTIVSIMTDVDQSQGFVL